MEELIAQYGGLVGVAAVVGLLVNVLKSAGVVQDGQAQTWSAGFNLVGMAGMLALKVFQPDFDFAGMDAQAAQFASVAAVVVGYILQLLSSKATNSAVRGVPIVGKSFSPDKV